MAFGKGALPSPPDEDDWQYVGLAGANASASLPTFRLGNRPPVTNQGDTPECVAYSSGVEQNWQDHVEWDRFFDWNEHLFFQRIGGTAAGAFMRAALDQRKAVGFPEADMTPSSAEHKIAGYAQVTKSVTTIKNAIVNTGGVLMIGPWYDNWTDGLNAKAVLPSPSGGSAGHAWWAIGWDEYGVICQNSWGTLWGDNGLFRMPWWIVLDRVWEVWSTLDEQTVETQAKAVIRELRTYLRKPKLVIGEDPGKLRGESLWGQTRRAGIFRFATRSIVASPWDQPFKYRGKRHGARHSSGPRGETWALLGIAGTEVAVPITQVRIVI